MGPPEPFGPPPPAPAVVDDSYGPQPVQYRPVILVLGPGMARGFAHAGVLRALSDAKIPIGAIIGTEMGALIGSLYALSGSINRFEWALLRFKDSTFLDKGGLLSSIVPGPSRGKNLEAALAEALGTKLLQDGTPRLAVIIRKATTDAVAEQDRGSATGILRGALAVPGMVQPGKTENPAEEWASAAAIRPYPVSEGKLLANGPVVVIDLLSSVQPPRNETEPKESDLIREELAQAKESGARDLADADLVIRPDLSGVAFLDYSKRNEASFKGKAAVKAKLMEIRRLVGMPSQEP